MSPRFRSLFRSSFWVPLTEDIRLVAAGAQVNYWEPELLQSTALHWAATNGHAPAIRKLTELGASVGPTNQVGTLPTISTIAAPRATCSQILKTTPVIILINACLANCISPTLYVVSSRNGSTVCTYHR